jgi:hypothetical protein
MRDLKLWVVALGVEAVLLAIGTHLDRTNTSLGAGIALALTQLPGSYLSELVVSNTAPQWLFDMLMFIVQTLVFGTVLHVIKFLKCKVANASNARPEPPK